VPLHLIHGPPNSGRTGLIQERFLDSLGRDPVLVVPTLDDVFSFQRELCESREALVGSSVMVFAGLFGEVARAAGIAMPAPLSEVQRGRLLRAAIAGASLQPLRRSAARPGFAAALDELISELQGAMLSPDSVASGASTLEGSAYLDDLTELYRAYAGLRDAGGYADAHTIAQAAIAALRQDPDSWGGRPVLLYGFDDLTVEQRELVATLAEAAEVTVSLTYEDRVALGDRARLYQQLRELGPATDTVTEADPANTPSPLLFHLERSFMSEEAEPAQPDSSLTLLRSAGDRGEAELVGSEIARLLASGTEPDQIAIALRDPARRGPLQARVLRGYGIPVALEAELPVAQSGTGSCLLALLRAAFTSRRASDLLAYLRGPRRAGPGQVDRLERAIRRGRIGSAAAAAEQWESQNDEPQRDLKRLQEAAADPERLLGEVARLARDIAQYPQAADDRRGELPDGNAATELRIGERIAGACEELAELEEVLPAPEELAFELEGLTMRSWTGPADGRVRIASPYDLRATRFAHLFVTSLQDGEFPRPGAAGPFLSDRQRFALGMPERAEPEDEERYLFHVCLARPTERLYLSYRTSDESGGAEPRSPFVEEVRRLLDPPPPEDGEEDPVEADLTRSRGQGELLFATSAAPSEAELARTLAAARADPEALPELDLPAERRLRLSAALREAARTDEATARPGGLTVPAVLEELAAVPAYGGTTLEMFDVCSYRWFVDHELRPRPLDPTPEPLTQGGLMHAALEKLYREAPGADSIPRPADLDAWIERGREIVDEVTVELGEHPVERSMYRRIERLLVAFLRREAGRRNPRVRPTLLEAEFGGGEEAERPRLQIGDWALHGRIDRVDEGEGVAVAFDYKLSREGTAQAKFVEKGTLQLPLYLLALRELWDLETVGGLYQPLRPTSSPRPRGLVLDEAEELLEDLRLYPADVLEGEDFEAALRDAADRATEAVARMRAGDIKRDPGPPEGVKGHGECPRFCTFAPICRRERAPFVLLPDDEDEDS
jgi:ATP-dependent helicase/DNAse subunit B